MQSPMPILVCARDSCFAFHVLSSRRSHTHTHSRPSRVPRLHFIPLPPPPPQSGARRAFQARADKSSQAGVGGDAERRDDDDDVSPPQKRLTKDRSSSSRSGDGHSESGTVRELLLCNSNGQHCGELCSWIEKNSFVCVSVLV